MKASQLTVKKKIALKLLAVITVVLVIFVINVQTNQPDNLPENYMECLKNPGMTGDYIGLWKSRWHEENKAWIYPAKQYAIYAVVALACLSAWVGISKAKFWK
ncbi:hypothetical protein [Streptococcus vestibularis]|uniref:hypothetical protein n=1 Tax=Streptococcus vestibularis TaxID=1343 RepID=UPI0020006E4F|nr:hypothetical protein [Streptococcus vestibularis]